MRRDGNVWQLLRVDKRHYDVAGGVNARLVPEVCKGFPQVLGPLGLPKCGSGNPAQRQMLSIEPLGVACSLLQGTANTAAGRRCGDAMTPIQRLTLAIRCAELTDWRHLWECSNHTVDRWGRLGRAKFQ